MPKVLNKRAGFDKIPPDAVYVGRPSKWGNPFPLERESDRERILEQYRQWLMARPDLEEYIAPLRGKDLVCWCAPKLCHADLLLELANNPTREGERT